MSAPKERCVARSVRLYARKVALCDRPAVETVDGRPLCKYHLHVQRTRQRNQAAIAAERGT